MCFVPKVSLATALLEFGVALWLYLKFPKKTLTTFFIVIVILLGVYQMSEFMLCTFGNPQIWGKVGFIDYTLIPAVTVYYTLLLINKKQNFWLVFSPALFFIIFALLDKQFIIEGLCSTLFVTIRNKFSYPDNRMFPVFTYPGYYYSYLTIAVISLGAEIKKIKEKNKKTLYTIMLFSIILTLLPPIILILVIPSLGIKFPSIYCHFAMILTLTTIIGSYIDFKNKK